MWPGVLVGDLLVNDYSALPLGSAIGQSCGNVLEIVVAAMLMRRFSRLARPLEGSASLGRMLLALAAATAVSATVGTLLLCAGDAITTQSMGTVWRTWWLGDSCGALVVVPLDSAGRARQGAYGRPGDARGVDGD